MQPAAATAQARSQRGLIPHATAHTAATPKQTPVQSLPQT